MDDLERFLDLVKRELGCDDARFEYGGREPETGRIWARATGGWRIVALYDMLPNDRAGKQRKLQGLIDTFTGVGEQLEHKSPRFATTVAAQEVDDALALLAEKTNALRALVIDEDSPVVWGSSEVPRGAEDVEMMMSIAELAESAIQARVDLGELVGLDDVALRDRVQSIEPRKVRDRLLRKIPLIRDLGLARTAEDWAQHFVVCRAVAAIRRAPERHYAVEDGVAWLTRDFGGIYHVVLVYDGEFSELQATGVMLRALPAIENLVLSLPPIEPTPKGARVIQFKGR